MNPVISFTKKNLNFKIILLSIFFISSFSCSSPESSNGDTNQIKDQSKQLDTTISNYQHEISQNIKEVTDEDGNTYNLINISEDNKTFMFGDNLKVTHFSNGDEILFAQSNEEWFAAGINETPAYCISDEGVFLYNWYALNDERGLAPKGSNICGKFISLSISTLTNIINAIKSSRSIKREKDGIFNINNRISQSYWTCSSDLSKQVIDEYINPIDRAYYYDAAKIENYIEWYKFKAKNWYNHNPFTDEQVGYENKSTGLPVRCYLTIKDNNDISYEKSKADSIREAEILAMERFKNNDRKNKINQFDIYNTNEVFETIDDNGKYIWLKKNLDVDHYLDGKPIPQAKTKEDIEYFRINRIGCYFYYNFDSANYSCMGKIYNYWIINNHFKLIEYEIIPNGWRIASQREWLRLFKKYALINFDFSDKKIQGRHDLAEFYCDSFSKKALDNGLILRSDCNSSIQLGGAYKIIYRTDFGGIGLCGNWWAPGYSDQNYTQAIISINEGKLTGNSYISMQMDGGAYIKLVKFIPRD